MSNKKRPITEDQSWERNISNALYNLLDELGEKRNSMDRSDLARRYSIVITDLEKVAYYFDRTILMEHIISNANI